MRASWLASAASVCAAVLCLAIPSYSQTKQDSPLSKQAPTTAPASQNNSQQDNNVDAIRILYTGKTFGYFRIPDWQGPAADGGGCKDPARQRDKSDAAAEFEQLLKTEFQIGKTKGGILVGTGDNFAPEIEARDFCNPPAGQPGAGKNYQRVGKELFDWDAISKQWIRSDSHSQGNAPPTNGLFMIPTDNVANFFVKEGYAALVPENRISILAQNAFANSLGSWQRNRFQVQAARCTILAAAFKCLEQILLSRPHGTRRISRCLTAKIRRGSFHDFRIPPI